MSGNTFVTEDRSRVFNRRANIKIFRLWIVGRDEKESGWVFVVNARRIHKAARAGWFERFRQLPDLKRAEIIWQGHKTVLFQKADHFCLATFVRFQERFLIRRDLRGAFW